MRRLAATTVFALVVAACGTPIRAVSTTVPPILTTSSTTTTTVERFKGLTEDQMFDWLWGAAEAIQTQSDNLELLLAVQWLVGDQLNAGEIEGAAQTLSETCMIVEVNWQSVRLNLWFPGNWPEYNDLVERLIDATDRWISACIDWGADPFDLSHLEDSTIWLDRANRYMQDINALLARTKAPFRDRN